MAIIIYKEGNRLYISGTGAVSEPDKKRADLIDEALRAGMEKLEEDFISKGLISQEGVKKDALQVWYRIGYFLNKVSDKFNIVGTSDESYYWQTIYSYASSVIQRGSPPVSKNTKRNHFRLCAYMAKKEWDFVKEVGNWSVWRDLLDNIRLQEDSRIFEWVINAIHKSKAGHKEMRPFIHEVRRTIKNKDTKVLTDKELFAKLQPLLELLPQNN